MLDVLMRALRPSGQYPARDAWERAERLAQLEDALADVFPHYLTDEDAAILIICTALRMRTRGMAPTRVMKIIADVYDLPTVELPAHAQSAPDVGSADIVRHTHADGAPCPLTCPGHDHDRDLDAHSALIPDGCLCIWKGDDIETRNVLCPHHGDSRTTH